MKLLEVENISKTYKIGEVEVRALQDVSLTIHAGEFIAIMGPSGSGKSTLMHLLGFLDRPDSGTVRLMGRDTSRLSDEAYAFLRNRVVGFVFQQFNLMARSTALENVCLPLLYSDDRAGDLDRSREMLARVGLSNRTGHRPNELSGGQQQRVAFARALVTKPLMILADEPTGNLDSRAGQEILGIFKELHRQGMTIVLVTHGEEVGKEAERVVRMHDGKIVSDERRIPAKEQSVTGIADLDRGGSLRKKRYNYGEFLEHFRLARRVVLNNKLRSFLSILGVLIGWPV